jgi:hypothetical protein
MSGFKIGDPVIIRRAEFSDLVGVIQNITNERIAFVKVVGCLSGRSFELSALQKLYTHPSQST